MSDLTSIHNSGLGYFGRQEALQAQGQKDFFTGHFGKAFKDSLAETADSFGAKKGNIDIQNRWVRSGADDGSVGDSIFHGHFKKAGHDQLQAYRDLGGANHFDHSEYHGNNLY